MFLKTMQHLEKLDIRNYSGKNWEKKTKTSKFLLNTAYGFGHFIVKITGKGAEKDVKDDRR